MKLAIVVPVKAYADAKQRLEGVLTVEERADLAAAMAQDVLEVVAALRGCGRYVVSDEPRALDLARALGLTALEDRERMGQSAAVRQGLRVAVADGYDAALTVPADVPGIEAVELKELCEFPEEVDVVLVPDRERRGTNGLRLIPPDAIGLRFGDESLALHQAEAVRAQRTLAVVDLRSLACDLDRWDDLAAFMRCAPDTRTMRLLRDLRVADRLAARWSRTA